MQTLAFTAATTSVGLADDLHKGLIDRFRSLPISRSAVLAGRTTADWLQNLFVLLVMAACGLVVGWRIHDGFLKALAGFVLLMLFAYAMSWIGATIGLSVRTVEAAQHHRLHLDLPADLPVQRLRALAQDLTALAAGRRGLESGLGDRAGVAITVGEP